MIPGLPIPHFLSPWTNEPHKIDPPGQMVPIKLDPHGQLVSNYLVPNYLIPLDKWSSIIWSPWTNGPQPIWSLYFPIACPSGQTEYYRDHLSWWTKLVGDHLPRGTNCGGPNVSQPLVCQSLCQIGSKMLPKTLCAL